MRPLAEKQLLVYMFTNLQQLMQHMVVSYLPPRHCLCPRRGANNRLKTSSKVSDIVRIVGQDVHEFGTHSGFANGAMLAPVVDVPIAGTEQTTRRSGRGNRSTFGQGHDTKRTNEARKVVVGLNSVTKNAIAV
jgi:hypothetical protein